MSETGPDGDFRALNLQPPSFSRRTASSVGHFLPTSGVNSVAVENTQVKLVMNSQTTFVLPNVSPRSGPPLRPAPPLSARTTPSSSTHNNPRGSGPSISSLSSTLNTNTATHFLSSSFSSPFSPSSSSSKASHVTTRRRDKAAHPLSSSINPLQTSRSEGMSQAHHESILSKQNETTSHRSHLVVTRATKLPPSQSPSSSSSSSTTSTSSSSSSSHSSSSNPRSKPTQRKSLADSVANRFAKLSVEAEAFFGGGATDREKVETRLINALMGNGGEVDFALLGEIAGHVPKGTYSNDSKKKKKRIGDAMVIDPNRHKDRNNTAGSHQGLEDEHGMSPPRGSGGKNVYSSYTGKTSEQTLSILKKQMGYAGVIGVEDVSSAAAAALTAGYFQSHSKGSTGNKQASSMSRGGQHGDTGDVGDGDSDGSDNDADDDEDEDEDEDEEGSENEDEDDYDIDSYAAEGGDTDDRRYGESRSLGDGGRNRVSKRKRRGGREFELNSSSAASAKERESRRQRLELARDALWRLLGSQNGVGLKPFMVDEEDNSSEGHQGREDHGQMRKGLRGAHEAGSHTRAIQAINRSINEKFKELSTTSTVLVGLDPAILGTNRHNGSEMNTMAKIKGHESGDGLTPGQVLNASAAYLDVHPVPSSARSHPGPRTARGHSNTSDDPLSSPRPSRETTNGQRVMHAPVVALVDALTLTSFVSQGEPQGLGLARLKAGAHPDPQSTITRVKLDSGDEASGINRRVTRDSSTFTPTESNRAHNGSSDIGGYNNILGDIHRPESWLGAALVSAAVAVGEARGSRQGIVKQSKNKRVQALKENLADLLNATGRTRRNKWGGNSQTMKHSISLGLGKSKTGVLLSHLGKDLKVGDLDAGSTMKSNLKKVLENALALNQSRQGFALSLNALPSGMRSTNINGMSSATTNQSLPLLTNAQNDFAAIIRQKLAEDTSLGRSHPIAGFGDDGDDGVRVVTDLTQDHTVIERSLNALSPAAFMHLTRPSPTQQPSDLTHRQEHGLVPLSRQSAKTEETTSVMTIAELVGRISAQTIEDTSHILARNPSTRSLSRSRALVESKTQNSHDNMLQQDIDGMNIPTEQSYATIATQIETTPMRILANLNRKLLTEMRVSPHDIDRLQRVLLLYSSGFHQVIKIIRHTFFTSNSTFSPRPRYHRHRHSSRSTTAQGTRHKQSGVDHPLGVDLKSDQATMKRNVRKDHDGPIRPMDEIVVVDRSDSDGQTEDDDTGLSDGNGDGLDTNKAQMNSHSSSRRANGNGSTGVIVASNAIDDPNIRHPEDIMLEDTRGKVVEVVAHIWRMFRFLLASCASDPSSTSETMEEAASSKGKGKLNKPNGQGKGGDSAVDVLTDILSQMTMNGNPGVVQASDWLASKDDRLARTLSEELATARRLYLATFEEQEAELRKWCDTLRSATQVVNSSRQKTETQIQQAKLDLLTQQKLTKDVTIANQDLRLSTHVWKMKAKTATNRLLMLQEEEAMQSNELMRLNRMKKLRGAELETLKARTMKLNSMIASEQMQRTMIQTKTAELRASLRSQQAQLTAVMNEYAKNLKVSESISHRNGAFAVKALVKVAQRERFSQLLGTLAVKGQFLAEIDAEYKKKLNELEEKQQQSMRACEELQIEVDRLEGLLGEAKGDLLSTEDDMDTLLRARDERAENIREAEKTIEACAESARTLAANLDEAERKTALAREQGVAMEAEIKAIQEETAAVKQSCQRLALTVSDNLRSYANLTTSVHALEDQVREKMQEYELNNAQHLERLRRSKVIAANLNKQLDKARANQQKAEKKLAETQARYQTLTAETQSVKEAIRQAFLNTQLVSQKIAQAHAENKRGVEAINRLKVEIPRIEAELPHTKRLRQEKEFDLQVKIEDLKIKLANLKQTKEKLEVALQSVVSAHTTEAEERARQRAEQDEKLLSLSSTIELLKKEVQLQVKKQQRAFEMKEHLESSRSEALKLKAQLAPIEKSIDQLKELQLKFHALREGKANHNRRQASTLEEKLHVIEELKQANLDAYYEQKATFDRLQVALKAQVNAESGLARVRQLMARTETIYMDHVSILGRGFKPKKDSGSGPSGDTNDDPSGEQDGDNGPQSDLSPDMDDEASLSVLTPAEKKKVRDADEYLSLTERSNRVLRWGDARLAHTRPVMTPGVRGVAQFTELTDLQSRLPPRRNMYISFLLQKENIRTHADVIVIGRAKHLSSAELRVLDLRRRRRERSLRGRGVRPLLLSIATEMVMRKKRLREFSLGYRGQPVTTASAQSKKPRPSRTQVEADTEAATKRNQSRRGTDNVATQEVKDNTQTPSPEQKNEADEDDVVGSLPRIPSPQVTPKESEPGGTTEDDDDDEEEVLGNGRHGYVDNEGNDDESSATPPPPPPLAPLLMVPMSFDGNQPVMMPVPVLSLDPQLNKPDEFDAAYVRLRAERLIEEMGLDSVIEHRIDKMIDAAEDAKQKGQESDGDVSIEIRDKSAKKVLRERGEPRDRLIFDEDKRVQINYVELVRGLDEEEMFNGYTESEGESGYESGWTSATDDDMEEKSRRIDYDARVMHAKKAAEEALALGSDIDEDDDDDGDDDAIDGENASENHADNGNTDEKAEKGSTMRRHRQRGVTLPRHLERKRKERMRMALLPNKYVSIEYNTPSNHSTTGVEETNEKQMASSSSGSTPANSSSNANNSKNTTDLQVYRSPPHQEVTSVSPVANASSQQQSQEPTPFVRTKHRRRLLRPSGPRQGPLFVPVQALQHDYVIEVPMKQDQKVSTRDRTTTQDFQVGTAKLLEHFESYEVELAHKHKELTSRKRAGFKHLE